ncbi:hypothetical protein KUV89_04215 [Marinobacter hydrocarbonoclasticus]|nr:hypothetical protein [Marinobacter nauticus]
MALKRFTLSCSLLFMSAAAFGIASTERTSNGSDSAAEVDNKVFSPEQVSVIQHRLLSSSSQVLLSEQGMVMRPLYTLDGKLITNRNEHPVVALPDGQIAAVSQGQNQTVVILTEDPLTLLRTPALWVNPDREVLDDTGAPLRGRNGEKYKMYSTGAIRRLIDAEGQPVVTVTSEDDQVLMLKAHVDLLTGEYRAPLGLLNSSSRITNLNGVLITSDDGRQLRAVWQGGEYLSDVHGRLVTELVDSSGKGGDYAVLSQTSGGTTVIRRPALILSSDGQILDGSKQEMVAVNGGPMILRWDSTGAPLQAPHGYVIEQWNGQSGQYEQNTLYVNPQTQELWTDFSGRGITRKWIPEADANSRSGPKPGSVSNSLVGFRAKAMPMPPVHATSATYLSPYHLFSTDEDSQVVVGGNTTHWPFSGSRYQLNANHTSEVQTGEGTGIFDIEACDFDPSGYITHMVPLRTDASWQGALTSLNSSVSNDESLTCLPDNVRQWGTSVGIGMHAVLTHDNELWSTGYAGWGLGGLPVGDLATVSDPMSQLSHVSVPVKWAEDVRLITSGWGNTSPGATAILDNQGQLFSMKQQRASGGYWWSAHLWAARSAEGAIVSATSSEAEDGGFVQFNLPAGDPLVNVFPLLGITSSSGQIGASDSVVTALGVTLSGDIYKLSTATAPTKVTVTPAIAEVTGFNESFMEYLDGEGNVYLHDWASGTSKRVTYISSGNVDGRSYPVLTENSANRVTFELLSLNASNNVYQGSNGKLYIKGSSLTGLLSNMDRDFSSYISRLNAMLVALQSNLDINRDVMIELNDSIPLGKFLTDTSGYKMMPNNPLILVNESTRQVAVVNVAPRIYSTLPANPVNAVTTLPATLSSRLFLD